MKNTNVKNNSFVITRDVSIEEAMGAITDNQRGTVAVVDERGVFQGVVSDGDIRRAMLKGATRMTPIEKIINVSATAVTEAEAKAGKVQEIFDTHDSINLLPVVDESNTLVDIKIRNPHERKQI